MMPANSTQEPTSAAAALAAQRHRRWDDPPSWREMLKHRSKLWMWIAAGSLFFGVLHLLRGDLGLGVTWLGVALLQWYVSGLHRSRASQLAAAADEPQAARR
jgi:hypothetical protein